MNLFVSSCIGSVNDHAENNINIEIIGDKDERGETKSELLEIPYPLEWSC